MLKQRPTEEELNETIEDQRLLIANQAQRIVDLETEMGSLRQLVKSVQLELQRMKDAATNMSDSSNSPPLIKR